MTDFAVSGGTAFQSSTGYTPSAEARRIILASASPRRRAIFDLLAIPHEVTSSDIDEKAIGYSTARELAVKTAFAKALAVEPRYPAGTLVVTADTVVVLDGRVYMKPDDAADARRMLGELSGRVHSVITGVAVREAQKSTLIDAVETRVEMEALSPEQIREYVASGVPLDKAGAYAVQSATQRVVRRIDGDYFNVVGLPIAKVLEMMALTIDVTRYTSKLPELARSDLVPDWVLAQREQND